MGCHKAERLHKIFKNNLSITSRYPTFRRIANPLTNLWIMELPDSRIYSLGLVLSRLLPPPLVSTEANLYILHQDKAL